eukprot:1239263-Rhodomonas_salina.1
MDAERTFTLHFSERTRLHHQCALLRLGLCADILSMPVPHVGWHASARARAEVRKAAGSPIEFRNRRDIALRVPGPA